jgi:hypothetical protein
MGAGGDIGKGAPCPPVAALAALLAGKLSAADLNAVAAHLEACAGCSSSLDELLSGSDPLVDGLRRPVPAELSDNPEHSRAAELVEALGRQLTASPGAEPTDPAATRAETADHAQPALGQLGQYELLEKLGEGGMGQVFKARHRLMGRIVALKVIHEKHLDHPGLLPRFQREIRALAQLVHPNIVRAEYADAVDGTHFLVMEYVPRQDLAALVRERGPLPAGPALPVVLVRDGCLSFRLAEHVEALPEEKKERWDSEQQVSPFLLKVEVFQQHTAEVSWTVRLAGIVCVIEAKLPFSPAFGRLDVQCKDRMGGREVVRCEFKPGDALITLFRDQEPLAQLERPIKWASGGPQYPSSFTAYWCDLRPDTPPAPADLARALVGAAK